MFVACITAIVFAMGFAALGSWRKVRAAWIAAVMWLAYAGYEMMMYLRIWCSGECNIRVDLLLFYPLLLVVTLVAIVKAVRKGKSA